MLKNKLTITAAAIALVMLATACTTKPNSFLRQIPSDKSEGLPVSII